MDQFLTEKEFKLITDDDYLLTKAIIIEKTVAKFENLRVNMIAQVAKSEFKAPGHLDVSVGKVFRGENYKKLPYIVLDYPKHFSRESVFAFRTMFWWGNFFSITLHLEGEDLENLRKTLIQNRDKLKGNRIWFCCNSTPWEYRYQDDNYIEVDKLTSDELKSELENRSFIKLSRKIELTDYGKLEKFCLETLAHYLNVIAKPE